MKEAARQHTESSASERLLQSGILGWGVRVLEGGGGGVMGGWVGVRCAHGVWVGERAVGGGKGVQSLAELF